MAAYLAHIAEDGREQTVLEHLEGTAAYCQKFAADFDAEEKGLIAGLAHDLGKYSKSFQKRLYGGPKVDHATAGAYECYRRGHICAAFAIAGHHGKGLPDGGGKGDGPGTGTFRDRMGRAAQGKLDDYSDWKRELSLPVAAGLDYFQEDGLSTMFFIRMLFSCLVDADYTDTGVFMDGPSRDNEGTASIEQLWERLQAYISGWFPPKGQLNVWRCLILQQCMREGEHRAPGLYTLTVPTGGGKTVSSLSFALAQAKAQGMKRIVYVIPYTSIIEQTADKFREILGQENVLEHHSDVQFEVDENGELTPEAQKLVRACETWDMPVVVTTAVQFFESLFSCKPSQCRKLHNLARSVIIFDEAQMLPLPYLRPCVWAIGQLVQYYHASVVLCTATQPVLKPLLREFAPELPVEELCPMEAKDWDAFHRVTFKKAGKLTWEALADKLQEQQQVLCVVNSRRAAQTVFYKLTGEGNFHLSTLMCPAHREAVLKEIRRRLQEGLPCRVVSTSVIEAGVDVDFPAVYREMAGLDSILQAAGRCNREGKRAPEDSIVIIFQGEDKPPQLFATSIGVGERILAQFSDFSSQEAVHAYFKELLELNGQAAQDSHDIMDMMKRNLFPFRKVAEQFHLIESPTVTVYIPQNDGEKLIAQLRNGEYSHELYRQLGRYGATIYEDHCKKLYRAGLLDQLEDGSFVLNDLRIYDDAIGLKLDTE